MRFYNKIYYNASYKIHLQPFMLVPSSAYLLQPFILKLILRGPSQSILGCFAGCVQSRRGYVCGGTLGIAKKSPLCPTMHFLGMTANLNGHVVMCY